MMREGRFHPRTMARCLRFQQYHCPPSSDDGILVPYTANVLALAVNSNIVKPADEPKKLERSS